MTVGALVFPALANQIGLLARRALARTLKHVASVRAARSGVLATRSGGGLSDWLLLLSRRALRRELGRELPHVESGETFGR